MATADFILFPGPAGWRVARVSRGQSTAFEVPVAGDAAAAVRTALDAQGFNGRPVVLALASGDCLSARIATADLPRGDRRAMVYRLEEKLPVSAEQVVADFVPFNGPTSAGDGALGTCVLLDRVAPVVTALEAAGVPVRRIVPAALAEAQYLASVDPGDGSTPTVFLIGETGGGGEPRLSVITVQGDRPLDWAVLPATVADVTLHLDLLATDVAATLRIVAHRVPADLTRSLSRRVMVLSDSITVGLSAAIVGHDQPWFDFRRDALAVADPLRQHRRAINGVLATIAAALVVVAGSAFGRSLRYGKVETNARARMVADFREHFPGWVTPTNVRAVIEGEHRRAAAATTGGSASSGADYGSAFASFRDVLSALPDGDRFSLDKISFLDGSFELTGRLQSYEQVDAIAVAARRSGMDVAPPQTRRDVGGTWAFTLQGTRRTADRGRGR